MNEMETPKRIWIDPHMPELQVFFKTSTEGFVEYARIDPPAAPTVATEPRQCLKCQHEERFSDNEGGMCERFIGQDRKGFDLKCGCYCEFPSAPPAPDEVDQTLERQTRKMAKKEASQADTIILHQATDGHYHWFCRNCKSERLGISRETVLSDYLPNVTCANCGFQFGVDKRYLSSTEPPAVSEPSALALPEWSDCEAAVDEKTATPLQRFIYEYEPGDNDEEWRERLAAALAQARKEGAQGAWETDGPAREGEPMTQPSETQELKHQTVGMQIVNNWHSGNYADLIAAIDNALAQHASDTRAPVDSQGAEDDKYHEGFDDAAPTTKSSPRCHP